MRQTINPLRQLGDIDIENINLNDKSRDDTPAILIGLQKLYSDPSRRARLLALLEEGLVPDVNHKLGRPGIYQLFTLYSMMFLCHLLFHGNYSGSISDR